MSELSVSVDLSEYTGKAVTVGERLSLAGATVIVAQPGDRLAFVMRQMPTDPKDIAELVEIGQRHFAGIEVLFVCDVTEVVFQPGEPLNDIEATGSCCCNGCIGMGPCDLEFPEIDEDAAWRLIEALDDEEVDTDELDR